LPKTGRPHIFNQKQEEAIIEEVKSDRKLTPKDIFRDPKLNKVHATSRTISNVLTRDGLKARTSQAKLFPPEAREKRIQFAKNMWINQVYGHQLYF